MEVEEARSGRGGRRQRFMLEQKRQMVEATLAAGASVARVAREYGVNANQVFAWRRTYKQGLLADRGVSGVKLLPVHIAEVEAVDLVASAVGPRSAGSIHMEFPGKALVTIEGRPDRESLRMIIERLLR